MTHRVKWAISAILIYVVFVVCAVVFDLLDPRQIGLAWTIFWYVVVAGIVYYLYFKNLAYQEVLYYARQLHLSKTDLAALVPNRPKTVALPDPAHPSLLAPVYQLPLSVTNQLTEVLIKRAKEAGIPRFE